MRGRRREDLPPTADGGFLYVSIERIAEGRRRGEEGARGALGTRRLENTISRPGSPRGIALSLATNSRASLESKGILSRARFPPFHASTWPSTQMVLHHSRITFSFSLPLDLCFFSISYISDDSVPWRNPTTVYQLDILVPFTIGCWRLSSFVVSQ